jgi:xanthine dehydrogenase YagR molybdenum-binding subunit
MSTAAPDPKENQGKPEPRIDARLKVMGEARYAADIPVSNLAYGVLVASDIARGRVTNVRTDEARAVPGVLDILSYGAMEGVKPPKFGNSSFTSLGPLHQPAIWHDGQIVALVVADSFETAREGAEKVSVTYEQQPASASFESHGTEVLPAKGNAQQVKEYPKAGDFEAAFNAAPVKIEAEYNTPTQTHNPIELFSTTCEWRGDQLIVYEPSQNVYGLRAAVAEQLGIDLANIRVVSPYVGGGFGSKGPMTPRTAIVAVAARRVNRPVRCVVNRMQGFTTAPYRAPTRQIVRLGADRDGKVTAFSHRGWELTSRTDNYAVFGVKSTARLYGWGSVETEVNLVKADRQTPAYMRSPPELPYVFGMELALDELAEKLGMDPIEIRRINDTKAEPIGGKPYSSRSLMQCYDAAAKAFNWSARNPKPGSMRDGDWLIGMGCASAFYPSNVGAAAARVKLHSDGTVLVQSATHEIGTGVRTVAGQMAAEQLAVDLRKVHVETGDTELPPAPVSGGSNSTASVCSTVLKACQQIRQKLFTAATGAKDGPLKGRDPSALSMRDGAIVAPDGASQKLADAFKALGAGAIEEYAEFIPEGGSPEAMAKLYGGQTTMVSPEQRPFITYAMGAEFVEVRINARTREIRVPRLVGAFAAGRIMNTRTARSQLMGGLIWGMSSALLESTEVDERNARYINKDLAEYLVPVNADVPHVEVIMLPEVDERINPAGVKGLGELGNVGTNAAIAAAVYHATGKRIRDLPIRIDDLIVSA